MFMWLGLELEHPDAAKQRQVFQGRPPPPALRPRAEVTAMGLLADINWPAMACARRQCRRNTSRNARPVSLDLVAVNRFGHLTRQGSGRQGPEGRFA